MFLEMQDFDFFLPKPNQILPNFYQILANLTKFNQILPNLPKFCPNLRKKIC